MVRILATVLAMLWAQLVVSQEVLGPEPGIEATIGAQIEAFKVDDFAEALTYASPNIQGMFGSHERFGLMVKNGYPMVWRPDDVQYGELREVAGNFWQRVEIVDQSGARHLLDYQMIQTPDGWRINGVQLLPPPGVSA